MKCSIKTRNYGRITFSRPSRGYIFVDLNGNPGTLGFQLCENGKLSGSTMAYYGEDWSEFQKICGKWWDKFRRDQKQ